MAKRNYFTSGPALLPDFVLEQAANASINFADSGLSIFETYHRSELASELINSSKMLLRQLLSIPSNFEILLVAGGASQAFAMIPMNFPSAKIGYLVNGYFSTKAYAEAQRISSAHYVINEIQYPKEDYSKLYVFQIRPHTDFVYYVSNETIDGVQINGVGVDNLLIADMSSDIMTREIDWNRHGIVFASCAKNLGIAGMHVVIIRQDLIRLDTSKNVARIFDYAELSKANSVYNSLPLIQVFMLYQMLLWTHNNGGVKHFIDLLVIKSKLVYGIINCFPEVYVNKISDSLRSKTNVVFTLANDKQDEFVAFCAKHEIYGIVGHRNKGGCRIALYNSVSLEQTKKLANVMLSFAMLQK